MSFDNANAKIVEWADSQGMFKRAEDPALRVISLGAGVQSTVMALMSAHGEIGPMPDCAIFADTGFEPAATYAALRWLMSDNVLPFPVHVVSRGNLKDDCLANVRGEQKTGKRATLPAFAKNKDGDAGMLMRHCTADYKVWPIQKKLRKMLGYAPRQRIPKDSVEVWLGISTDEASRIRPAQVKWQSNYWPLIDAGMSRRDCLDWLDSNGYPRPPKSACVACPFHNDGMWRDMRDNDPASWDEAVKFDAEFRSGFEGGKSEIFLHRSLKPLDQVDLSTAEDRGQLNFFINECEGMCGL